MIGVKHFYHQLTGMGGGAPVDVLETIAAGIFPHTGGIGADLIDGLETGDKTEFIQRDRLE